MNAPSFLLSTHRSGSTLLSWVIDSHPQISCPPEMWIGALHRSCDHRSDECEPWDGIGHRLAFEKGVWVPEPGFFETCTSLD